MVAGLAGDTRIWNQRQLRTLLGDHIVHHVGHHNAHRPDGGLDQRAPGDRTTPNQRRAHQRQLGNIPIAHLSAIIVGLPLVATAVSWLASGREPVSLVGSRTE